MLRLTAEELSRVQDLYRVLPRWKLGEFKSWRAGCRDGTRFELVVGRTLGQARGALGSWWFPCQGPLCSSSRYRISGASIFQSHKTVSNTASGGPSHHAKSSHHGGCGFHSGLGRTLRARISIPSLQDGSLGGAVRHSVNSTRRYFVPIRLFAAATLHGTTINAYGIISSHLANRGAPRWRKRIGVG
jgi:hypothetical protein